MPPNLLRQKNKNKFCTQLLKSTFLSSAIRFCEKNKSKTTSVPKEFTMNPKKTP